MGVVESVREVKLEGTRSGIGPGAGAMPDMVQVGNEITGGAIPRQFIKPVSEGIKDAMVRGFLAGYELVDIWITVFWLIGITNAINLLDNMDGVTAGVMSVILLLSDHGYLLGERGYTGKVPSQLHPELAQVPLIIVTPDNKAAGEVSYYFASTHDVGPTLLSMAGVGFAWASILSLPYALLSDSVPAEKMGVFMGIFNFFIVIPQIVAACSVSSRFRSSSNSAPDGPGPIGRSATRCATTS